jgi:YbbR domain-containing protein
MRALLGRWFVENAALKLVSLILAVTLYILVSGEKETERSLRVGVAYVRPEDRVLVSEVPDSVEVWVRGPWTRIKRLDPAGVDPIVVDLTKHADGAVRFGASDIRLPAGLEVSSIRPSSIQVQFERQKTVPVVPELVGAPPDGFIIEKVTAEPATVGVRGPVAAIAGIDDLRTLPMSVVGKRAPFRQEVALVPLGRDLITEVDTVVIDVQVVEEVRTRTLDDVPVQLRPPAGAPRATVTHLEAAPASVDLVLRGGASAMREVEPREITAFVELQVEDLAPGATRSAAVVVSGTPTGVAIEVHPREISVSMPAPGSKVQNQP